MRQVGLILAAGRVHLNKKNKKKSETPPHPKHTHLKMHFLKFWKHRMDLQPVAAMNTKVGMSDMTIVQPAEQPRASSPGSRTSEHMPLYPSCVRLRECFPASNGDRWWKTYIEVGFVRSTIRLA